MDYGYSFFLDMLSFHNVEIQEGQRRMAIAFRLAQNMNDKQWSKYIRRKL